MKNLYHNLADVVANSYSYADVLRKYNIVPAGGNYATLKKYIKEQNLSIEHFTGQGWNVGLKFVPRPAVPIGDKLTKNSHWNSSKLREQLISSGIKAHICESCWLSEWLGQPISLELDHIDGDHSNNLLENLRILCPNCHAQTSSYRGKNAKHSSAKYQRLKKIKPKVRPLYGPPAPKYNYCLDCRKDISMTSLRCKSCARKHKPLYKIEWPHIHELEKMLEESSYAQIGKILGVSDNAVRKHIKMHKHR